MNMFKKNGGFTLVELIVVIAILAILAGVAVPAYSGYISKAQEAADYTLLDSVKTAVIFEAIENDEGHDGTVTQAIVTENSTEVQIKGNNLSVTTVNIQDYVSAIDFKSSNGYAYWDGTEWELTNTAPSFK